jgi:magnesium transporter
MGTVETSPDLTPLIRTGNLTKLREELLRWTPQDLAATFCGMRADDQVIGFRILPRRSAATVFEYMPVECQHALVKAMGQEDVAALLNHMSPDDRTLLLSELPANATKQLLALLTPEERAEAITLLGYAPGTVGRFMTPHYIAVQEDWTVQRVLDYVREHGQNSETLNVVYVVDDAGVLIDDIRIREFLVVPLTKRVSDLMDRRFVALKATDTQESAVAVFRREDRTALPVTDTAGVLIGIVTVDDILDIAEEAATRELQKFGGSEALDEPYMQISLLRMVKKRGGWLVVLFLGEMLTATAMGFFEAEIARAVVLALFVPLIISSGGNSGSQASTLVIRALAVGSILGAIGFLRISIWSVFSNIYGPHWLLVATTVAVSLVGVVLWGTLVGSLLPFMLRRLGFDPATSSAPFVATLVDVTGLIIYFSVAVVVLRGTLL